MGRSLRKFELVDHTGITKQCKVYDYMHLGGRFCQRDLIKHVAVTCNAFDVGLFSLCSLIQFRCAFSGQGSLHVLGRLHCLPRVKGGWTGNTI